MRFDRRVRRSLAVAVSLAAALAACSGGSDADDTDDVAVTTAPATDTTLFSPSDDDIEAELTDEGLVPETVDEVVLDDDVIIATDDGQIPTTTSEPPPGPGDAAPDPGADDAPASTATSPPLPDPASVRRVVSLSPTHTATIAELGAAELLVGIDAESDPPDGAPIERDFLVADDLDVDDLLTLEVDLVVLGEDDGDVAAQDLADAGIAFVDGDRPADRAGVEQQILSIAAAIGRGDAGAALVEQMRADVEAIVSSLPPSDGLTYFHEFDPGFATYPAGSLIDALYGELGLGPIVRAADDEIIFVDESVVLNGDPDVIVLGDIDCCAATAERAAARDGWASLSAVRNGAIVEVPDDVANRWGANIVELMRLVAAGAAAAS